MEEFKSELQKNHLSEAELQGLADAPSSWESAWAGEHGTEALQLVRLILTRKTATKVEMITLIIHLWNSVQAEDRNIRDAFHKQRSGLSRYQKALLDFYEKNIKGQADMSYRSFKKYVSVGGHLRKLEGAMRYELAQPNLWKL